MRRRIALEASEVPLRLGADAPIHLPQEGRRLRGVAEPLPPPLLEDKGIDSGGRLPARRRRVPADGETLGVPRL